MPISLAILKEANWFKSTNHLCSKRPRGAHDIITGLRSDGEEDPNYNAGIRFSREFDPEEPLDVGLIELPFVGAEEGHRDGRGFRL